MSAVPLLIHRLIGLALVFSLILLLPSRLLATPTAAPDVQQQLNELTRQQQQLDLQAAELQEQLEALGPSPWVYQVLQQQRAHLPRLDNAPQRTDELAERRLQEFALNQQLRQARAEEADTSQLVKQQLQLQAERQALIQLQQQQSELLNTAQQLQQDIDEHLFWIPSNTALNFSWWQELPRRWAKLGAHREAYIAPPEQLDPRWGRFGLISLALVTLLVVRRRLQTAIHDLNLSQNDPEQPASPWRLVQALLLNASQVLPLPLALLAGAQLLAATPGSSSPLAEALVALALSGLVVGLVYQLLKPQGFAQQQLNWSSTTRDELRRFITPLGWLLIPASFILTLLKGQPLLLPEDPLGPLILIALGLLLAAQLARLMWRLPPLYASPLVHSLITLALVALPLTLATITSLGYYYTGLQLMSQLLATLYLLVAWVVTEATLFKAIHQATARLAHQRAIQAAREPLSSGESGEEMASRQAPPPQLEVEQIHQQALRLARFFLLVGFGCLLYWIWSDVFSLFSYLDRLSLPVSINDLLLAAFILVFSFFMAANLPGLLEILILSRLQLQQGSAYAITSLLNYAIMGTGLVLVLATLGVSWDKLQWLVAALSVGLGFGLQEIFANFISGLILLFERPVRIGDVVTLGNLSGRVRQIRIRATIITDFDRKDIIVPNKSFITGQLINWSLSDTVTRVVIKIGVAYGSDLDQTRAILLAAAEKNARVLSDPAPQVLFLEFGESTLNHELRIHVKELSDRNPAIDEINRFVDQRFKEEGIEIAFRQLDIHLRNSEGVEKLVARKQPPLP